MESTGLSFL